MENSKIKLKYPIAIVAYDAGAANLLYYYAINFLDLKNCRFVVDGPAAKIFKNKNIINTKKNKLKKIILNSSTLISGTGLQSYLEHNSRKIAREHKINSIAILDHWKNYNIRFIKNDITILPDEIWVFDKFAYKIAKKKFNLNILLKKNYYYEYIYSKYYDDFKKKKFNKKKYLYLMEPLDKYKNYKNLIDPFDYFIKNFYKLNHNNDYEIIVKPHPSQYDKKIYNNSRLKIKFDYESSLLDLLRKSNVVIGFETAALILALKCKKKVYSSIPPGYGKLILPYKNIKEIRNI